MNFLARKPKVVPITDTLDDLWAEAELFGSVRIFSDGSCPLPSRYRCYIEFQCETGMSLEATSEHKLPLKQALKEAITNAKRIQAQFKA